MKERLEKRLAELRAEFAEGQTQLADADNRATQLRETLLRIAGAIQVLQEELGDEEPEQRPGPMAVES